MSVGTKRSLAQAIAVILEFGKLIDPATTCEQWNVVGSVRRLCPSVGDVDICCIPRFGAVPVEGDLFASPVRTNLLWRRVDDLVKSGTFTKHTKDTVAGPRRNWGLLQRAVGFGEMAFEMRICDPDNWPLKLAIHTGPEQLSKRFVSPAGIPRAGLTIKDGFHIFDRDGRELKGLTEPDIFRLADLPYSEPENRK